MKKLIILIVSSIFATFVIFLSCKKTESQSISSVTVSINRDFNFKLEIDPSASSMITQETKFSKYGKQFDYVFNSMNLPNTEFENISKLITAREKVIGFVAYLRNNDKNIGSSNIIGLSIYLSDGDKGQHKYFTNSNGVYCENPKLSAMICRIASNHAKFIAFTQLDEKVESMVIVTNMDYSAKLRYCGDGLIMKELVYERQFLRTMKNSAKSPDIPSTGSNPDNCGVPCEDGNFMQICYHEGLPNWQCFSGPPDGGTPDDDCCCCFIVTKEVLINQNVYSLDSITVRYQEEKHRNFRDTFLMPSGIGFLYVRAFYAVSAYVRPVLGVSTSTKVYNILPKINVAIDKLRNPGAYGSDTLINSALRVEMVTLLTEVKGLHTDTDFENLVDILISDVGYFENKTVNQVLVDF